MEYISFVVLISVCLECVLSFNLEHRIPIIKRGERDSYFGYSVAQHQSVDEGPPNRVQSWLLVGAPLGQNEQPGTNRSGALFKCPITSRVNDCTQVITDGKRTIGSDELQPPLHDEIKDGQWLGVTVRSQGAGGKVMVCAHRHIKKGLDFQWGQGLCYTLTQYLDFSYTWDPCKGRTTAKAHEQFGYCQAGTSGILLEDDMAVIGSPGPYTWRGTMFVMNISSDFLMRDKTYYYSPLKEPGAPKNEVSPVDKYSYLGMSVGAGKFFDNKVMYVAGAPRANGTGQVVFFSRTKGRNPMDVELTLSGEQFASSYGYELTTANVDGDNFTDLIVGAPFFFSRDKGGAVYVYTRLKRHCVSCNKPTVLNGLPESRFGFALTNLGDLNKDGYEDIAVGAPYEDGGAVYIYLGSKKGLIVEPSQVLHSEDLPASSGGVRTFGYSLSGGLDLDRNGYPDLLVGAYEEDAVVLLRSRPIIGIVTSVRPQENLINIDPTKRGCRRYPQSGLTCFTFSACCSIESLVRLEGGRGTELLLNYSIEAETRTSSRVFFAPYFETRAHIVRKAIMLDTKLKGEHCEEEVVFIKENTTDIQSPIKFRLTYKLVQREPRQVRPGEPLPSIDNFPILNQQQAAKTFTATFQKDCVTDICESRLIIDAFVDLPRGRKTHTELILGKHDQVDVNITVHNVNESAYAAQLYIFHPPSLEFMTFKSENKHQTCAPNRSDNSSVICFLGNPFKRGRPANFLISFDPRGVKDSESHLKITLITNSTSHESSPQGPVDLYTSVVRQAEVSLSGQAQPDRVLYGGEVVGESAISLYSQVGSPLEHVYNVYNKGPWKVKGLEILIDWPWQVGNNKPQGKWLLYLTELPVVDALGGGMCYMESGQVNPLGLEDVPSQEEEEGEEELSARRSKRDTEMVIIPEVITDKDGRQRKIVTMSCLVGSAKCIRIRCVIRELQIRQEATIVVKARLWNSTLVEDYPKVDSVHIWSHAKLNFPDKPHIHQDISDDENSAETVALPDRLDQHKPEPVPIWIIIVAVVAGLLLLVLLTLVLWKLGFFKRRRPDPTLSGNLEKHRDENGDYSS
ncbi:integrin alpha-PS1 isoform X2 [Anabrus simplex]|uniref:integrin alpha-PS1 isoform X2 n=1 Tax=Anabrus simplex TaxID=316456 RepID=UPI0034DD5639